VDLVRLAHYPFLPEVRQALRESGVSVTDLLSSPMHKASRDRAVQRVEGALEHGIPPPLVRSEHDAWTELLSVAASRMLVADAGEKPLLQRYAAAEARLAHDLLLRDLASLPGVLDALEIQADDAGGDWILHFSDYIRFAPQEPEWKLITRTLDAGRLRLSSPEMVRLAREALQRRLIADLEAETARGVGDDLAALLAPLAERLEPKLEEARKSWTSGDFGPVQPGLFPPCVKEIFGALQRSENVPHHGRFAFATFLHTIGWNAEQILDYLASTPNFDREKSRYQIEHITGQKGVESYMVPNCSTMQTNGVCPLEKRDGVCFRIKNPLGYYRVRLRLQQRDAAQAKPEPGGSPAAQEPAKPAASQS
jgi:DNA primase large subunit